MAESAFCNSRRKTKIEAGFTLVELIVVLSVLAILAAAGVGSAIGYVKKTRFAENEKNAEMIYQATQIALQQKEKNGVIEDWVKDILDNNKATAFDKDQASAVSSTNPLIERASNNSQIENKFAASAFNSLTEANAGEQNAYYSVHMRYCLTYTPDLTKYDSGVSSAYETQNKVVKDLIQPYFYDGTIFAGTITIEFDFEKSVDANKQLHYSTRCLSVFYNSRVKTGWDGYTVPSRTYGTRRNDTLTGYYNGYTGSLVDTVYLPDVKDGLDIRKLRYDSTTGMLTWNAYLNSENLTGTARNIYYRIDIVDDSGVSYVVIFNESFLFADSLLGNPTNVYEYVDPLMNYDPTTLKATLDTAGLVQYPVTTVTKPVSFYTTSDSFVESYVTRTTISIPAWAFTDVSKADQYLTLLKSEIDAAMTPITLNITCISGELNENGDDLDPRIEYSFNVNDVFGTGSTAKPASVEAIILTNGFTDSDMKRYNDTTGLIAMNKAVKLFIS